AGADLAALERIADASLAENLADAESLGQIFLQLRAMRKPVVALVRGRALAGGCGLATACDLVLCRDDAQLGYPEVNLGFVPAMVMTILRRKLGEGQAFELLVGGWRINAAEAERMALVQRVFPEAAFENEVWDYLADLAKRPPSAVRLSKRLLYGLDTVGFEEGIARGAEMNALARLTDACREGVRQFLQRARERQEKR
ncbi:MAG: enoyl-CoA hydratase/isomerase family protein, partial [Gemmatimonadetes bacterium]|nr:enoyl-CoA hydratase/isomerase family protein [Gemmatimonadota bacterium]